MQTQFLRHLLWITYLLTQSQFSLGDRIIDSPPQYNAVILTYHHVSTETPAITSISPEVFESHLQLIENENYQVWPLEKLTKWLKNGETLPANITAISFDDAYGSIFEEAFPRLQKRNWPFTIFVSTEAVDKGYGGQLSWQQLRIMSKHGATIANHSHRHQHLLQRHEKETEHRWLKRIIDDISHAQSRIQAEIGHAPLLFAYPYGEYNQTLAEAITKKGYISFGQHSGPIDQHSDFTALPRFPVAGNYAKLDEVKLKLHTLPLPATVIDTPENPLAHHSSAPTLTLKLSENLNPTRLNCYGPGGLLPRRIEGQILQIKASQQSPVGRFKYNCTYPIKPGKFYWFSKLWIGLTAENSFID